MFPRVVAVSGRRPRRTLRGRALGFTVAVVTLGAGPLGAQPEEASDCPPGWFCEPAGGPDGPHEGPASEGPAPEAPRPLPPPPLLVASPELEPAPPVRRRRTRTREWGVQLRLQTTLLGDRTRPDGSAERAHPDAGMLGLGVGLRYRALRWFAVEPGLDLFRGRDWYGDERSETALSVNTLFFVNPRHAVQLYFLAGLAASSATVSQEVELQLSSGDRILAERALRYSYFGGQLGMGLEFRLTRRTALDLDLVGFVRGRTDTSASSEPEFVDPETGRTTNASGGGLFRVGVTFYW